MCSSPLLARPCTQAKPAHDPAVMPLGSDLPAEATAALPATASKAERRAAAAARAVALKEQVRRPQLRMAAAACSLTNVFLLWLAVHSFKLGHLTAALSPGDSRAKHQALPTALTASPSALPSLLFPRPAPCGTHSGGRPTSQAAAQTSRWQRPALLSWRPFCARHLHPPLQVGPRARRQVLSSCRLGISGTETMELRGEKLWAEKLPLPPWPACPCHNRSFPSPSIAPCSYAAGADAAAEAALTSLIRDWLTKKRSRLTRAGLEEVVGRAPSLWIRPSTTGPLAVLTAEAVKGARNAVKQVGLHEICLPLFVCAGNVSVPHAARCPNFSSHLTSFLDTLLSTAD